MIVYTPGMTLEGMEKFLILAAFKFYRQNKTTTAKALGCAIRTLDTKLEKYAEEDKQLEQREIEQKRIDADWLTRQRNGNPPAGNGLPRPNAGVYVEPSVKIPPQSPMPMQERPQVQNLLPQSPTQSGTKRRG